MPETGPVWRNPLSGRQVLFAPQRSGRPMASDKDATLCPFCPGNEHLLPSILCERPADDARPWAARVVPNKYPLVTPGGGRADDHELAKGRHEVIIETPYHDHDLTQLSLAEMDDVMAMYCHRFSLLVRDHQTVALFRNQGRRAGASQTHAHAQIVAFDGVPDDIDATALRARNYYDRHSECVICSIVAAEADAGDRIVTARDPFIAFVPLVAEAPYDIWLTTRTHPSGFGEMNQRTRHDFGAILQDVLGRLARALDNPDFCFGLVAVSHPESEDHVHHWVMRIRPVLTTPGGLELVTGLSINPSNPEDDAAELRSAGSIQ